MKRLFFIALAVFPMFLWSQSSEAIRTLYPWFVGAGLSQNFFLNYLGKDDSLNRLGRLGPGLYGFVGKQLTDHWGLSFNGSYNMHFDSQFGASKGIIHLGSFSITPILHFLKEPWRGKFDPYVKFGAGIQFPNRRVLDNALPPYPYLTGAFGIDWFLTQRTSLYSEVGNMLAIKYMIPTLQVGISYHFGNPRVIIFED